MTDASAVNEEVENGEKENGSSSAREGPEIDKKPGKLKRYKITCPKCQVTVCLPSFPTHLKLIHKLDDIEAKKIYAEEKGNRVVNDEPIRRRRTRDEIISESQKEKGAMKTEDTVEGEKNKGRKKKRQEKLKPILPKKLIMKKEPVLKEKYQKYRPILPKKPKLIRSKREAAEGEGDHRGEEKKDTVAEKESVDDIIYPAKGIKSAVLMATQGWEATTEMAALLKDEMGSQNLSVPPQQASSLPGPPVDRFATVAPRLATNEGFPHPVTMPSMADGLDHNLGMMSRPVVMRIHPTESGIWSLRVSTDCFVGPHLSKNSICALGVLPPRPFPDQLVRIVQDILLCARQPQNAFAKIPDAVEGEPFLSITLCKDNYLMLKKIQVPKSLAEARSWLQSLLQALKCCPGLIADAGTRCLSCSQQRDESPIWAIASKFHTLLGPAAANVIIQKKIDYAKLMAMGPADCKTVFQTNNHGAAMVLDVARIIELEMEAAKKFK